MECIAYFRLLQQIKYVSVDIFRYTKQTLITHMNTLRNKTCPPDSVQNITHYPSPGQRLDPCSNRNSLAGLFELM